MNDIFADLPEDVSAERYVKETSSVNVNISDSELDLLNDSTNRQMMIRTLGEGRISSAVSSRPDDEERTLQRSLDALLFGSEARFEFPSEEDIDSIPLVDESLSDVSADTMVDIAEDLEESLSDFDSRIRVSALVSKHILKEHLTNSMGLDEKFEKTIWRMHLGGRKVDGDDFIRLGESRDACNFLKDYDDLKEEVIWQFEKAMNVVPIESGSYPAIFAPSQLVFVLRPFISSLMGNMIADGVSPLRDKIGEQIIDERINLVDDGTTPMHPASRPFDREGVPVQRSVLIQNGKPKNYLLDLQSAHRLELDPTGNGYPGRGPSHNHMILQSGNTPLQKMISDIDQGVLVCGSMGAWTGNPFSGNVSGTISLGYKIENGEVKGRIKDCMFSLNAFERLADSLIEFSCETKSSGMGYTFPYAAVDRVIIATNR